MTDERIFNEFKEIIQGQGSIKEDIAELRGAVNEIKNDQDDYERRNEGDHKKIEATLVKVEEDLIEKLDDLKADIQALQKTQVEHESLWSKVKGVKGILWVAIPGIIIVFGKFIITYLEKFINFFR